MPSEVNPALFLVEAIGKNLLDSTIDQTISGPIMSSLFGDQDAAVLSQIEEIQQQLQKVSLEILTSSHNDLCQVAMSNITTQWTIVSDSINQSNMRISDYLNMIQGEGQKPIFKDNDRARTYVADGANQIIGILANSNPNYIGEFFAASIQGLQIHGPAAFDQNGQPVPNAGAIQTLAGFLKPYVASILQACLVLEVCARQGLTQASDNENAIKARLTSLAGTTIPQYAGNLLELLRYETTISSPSAPNSTSALTGLSIFNLSPGMYAVSGPQGEIEPLIPTPNQSAGVFGIVSYTESNPPSTRLLFVPYYDDPMQGVVGMIYQPEGEADGGTWTGAPFVDNDFPQVSLIQVYNEIVLLKSPITNQPKYYVQVRIGAQGTNSDPNQYYMDNFYGNNNFLRASLGKYLPQQLWILDAPPV